MAKVVAHLAINSAMLKDARRRSGAPIALAIRDALRRVGKLWFRKFLPKHFEASAPRRYAGAYARRGHVYTMRKIREKGHSRPMVWSGRMRGSILGGAPQITGKLEGRTTKVDVRLPHARAVNLWSGRYSTAGNLIDFRRELTAVSPGEITAFRQHVEVLVARDLGRYYAQGSQEMQKKRMSA